MAEELHADFLVDVARLLGIKGIAFTVEMSRKVDMFWRQKATLRLQELQAVVQLRKAENRAES